MTAQLDPLAKTLDYSWHGIHAAQVRNCQEPLQPLIDELLRSQEDWDEETLIKALEARDLQLWVLSKPQEAVNMIVVTQLIDLGKSTTCHIVGVAGEDRVRYASFIPDVLEPWAREQGCDFIQAFGRDGWERVKEFKTQGWKKTAILLRKPLHAT